MFNTPVPFTKKGNLKYQFSIKDMNGEVVSYQAYFKEKGKIQDRELRDYADELGSIVYEFSFGDIFGYYGRRFVGTAVTKSIVSTIRTIADDFETSNDVDAYFFVAPKEKRTSREKFYEQVVSTIEYKDYKTKIKKFSDKTVYCYYKQKE